MRGFHGLTQPLTLAYQRGTNLHQNIKKKPIYYKTLNLDPVLNFSLTISGYFSLSLAISIMSQVSGWKLEAGRANSILFEIIFATDTNSIGARFHKNSNISF